MSCYRGYAIFLSSTSKIKKELKMSDTEHLGLSDAEARREIKASLHDNLWPDAVDGAHKLVFKDDIEPGEVPSEVLTENFADLLSVSRELAERYDQTVGLNYDDSTHVYEGRIFLQDPDDDNFRIEMTVGSADDPYSFQALRVQPVEDRYDDGVGGEVVYTHSQWGVAKNKDGFVIVQGYAEKNGQRLVGEGITKGAFPILARQAKDGTFVATDKATEKLPAEVAKVVSKVHAYLAALDS